MTSSDTSGESITWAELKSKYGLGHPATNCYLRGRVSYVDRENWKIVPNIRLCDATGVSEGAVFFYLPCDKNIATKNSSDVNVIEELDAIELGDEIVIREPKLHFFVDGQEGIRIDDPCSVVSITKATEVNCTDRLQYAKNMIAKAEKWIERKQYEIALDNLSTSVSLLSALMLNSKDREIMNNTSDMQVTCNKSIEEYLFLMLQAERLTCMCHSKEKKYAHLIEYSDSCCNTEKYKVFLCNENSVVSNCNDDSDCSDWVEKCNNVKEWLEDMVKMTCDAHVQLRQYKASLMFVTKWLVHLPKSTVLITVQEQLRREVNAEGKGFELLLRKRKDQYRLQGMHPRFGHQSNLFGSESNSKVTKGQEEQETQHLKSVNDYTEDCYKLNDAATALVNVRSCNGVDERCTYKRELLYVVECTSAQAFHLQWASIQRAKRIKTFILLNACNDRNCLGSIKEWQPHAHYVTMQTLLRESNVACNKRNSVCTLLRSSVWQWITSVCRRQKPRQWKCTVQLEDAEFCLQSIPSDEAVCISLQLPSVAPPSKEDLSVSVLPSSFVASSRQ